MCDLCMISTDRILSHEDPTFDSKDHIPRYMWVEEKGHVCRARPTIPRSCFAFLIAIHPEHKSINSCLSNPLTDPTGTSYAARDPAMLTCGTSRRYSLRFYAIARTRRFGLQNSDALSKDEC
jgi:hypothetical protein